MTETSPKTIREFLIRRGEDPEIFPRAIVSNAGEIEHHSRYADMWTIHTVVDIKRFGRCEVVLLRTYWYEGYPRIRRLYEVDVLHHDKEITHGAQYVYVDGGYYSARYDEQDPGFVSVKKIKREGHKTTVTVSGSLKTHTFVCEPPRDYTICACNPDPKKPFETPRNFISESELTKYEADERVREIKKRHSQLGPLKIFVKGKRVYSNVK